jgi:hypothetical protein
VTAPTPVPRKLGPGVLSVGSAGNLLNLAARCRSAKVTWGVKTEDDTPLLSGGVSAGDRTYSATLEATLEQDDLADGGNVAYTWTHKGEEQPAVYTPYEGGKSISGSIIVDPLDVGGDVGKKNTADIKWAFVGEPELVDDLS